jgi:1,4-dihydroxy-2-naphthoyl-CoA hydrolase
VTTADEATAFVRETMPLSDTLGVRAREFTAERVVLELDHAPELCTAGGLLHGGALMALADSAGAAVAFLNLPEGAQGTATIGSSTSFLAAVRTGTVRAVAVPLRVGRTTIVVETEIHDAGGQLVAKTTQSQAVRV